MMRDGKQFFDELQRIGPDHIKGEQELAGALFLVLRGEYFVSFINVLATAAALPPDLRLVPAISYQIVTPGGGAPTRLLRNGVLLAKDVEDMQVAWFFDADQNGEVDANEYSGGPGTAYNNELVEGGDLREIRVSLVVRTSTSDPRNPNSGSIGQALENRVSNIPGEDGRRRRLHSSTVRVRNVSS